MIDILDRVILRCRYGQKEPETSPKQGVFFLAQYTLNAAPVLEFDTSEKAAHYTFWKDYVAPKFIQYWKPEMPETYIGDIYEAYTMFPRGRVGYDDVHKKWYVYVGSPQQFSHDVKSAIINAFGLNAEQNKGNVEWIEDQHERRQKPHIFVWQKIVERMKTVKSKLNEYYKLVATKRDYTGIKDPYIKTVVAGKHK